MEHMVSGLCFNGLVTFRDTMVHRPKATIAVLLIVRITSARNVRTICTTLSNFVTPKNFYVGSSWNSKEFFKESSQLNEKITHSSHIFIIQNNDHELFLLRIAY